MDAVNVLKVDSEFTESPNNKGFMDDDIMFLNSIRGLAQHGGSHRLDRFMAMVCYAGKLQFEINMSTRSIHAGQIFICSSNDVVSDTMQSPDFDGAVLALSSNAIMNMFGESNMWDCFFKLTNHPIINARKESMEMIQIYYEAFRSKVKMGNTPFHHKIVSSIVKAVFYELMENVETLEHSDFSGLRHGDVLFKQFIELLSGSVVKSRNVAWYAEQLCITPKHLSTVCKRVSGKTAFDWINEYVAIDIRHQLKNSDKSIKEIVNFLKFPNMSFFGKYCRQHFGVSPTEYRKLLRKQGVNKTVEDF